MKKNLITRANTVLGKGTNLHIPEEGHVTETVCDLYEVADINVHTIHKVHRYFQQNYEAELETPSSPRVRVIRGVVDHNEIPYVILANKEGNRFVGVYKENQKMLTGAGNGKIKFGAKPNFEIPSLSKQAKTYEFMNDVKLTLFK